jgi:hypothetical protein
MYRAGWARSSKVQWCLAREGVDGSGEESTEWSGHVGFRKGVFGLDTLWSSLSGMQLMLITDARRATAC